MADGSGSRKTRAIMFSDIYGYSRMMGEDEQRALALLDEHNRIVVPLVQQHGGTVVKFIGDAVLASYESAADAVLAAMDIQRALAHRNSAAAMRDRVNVRIGIHVGDVLLKDNDAFGDGVNVAARIEPLAPVGGVAISQTVHDMVRAVPQIRTTSMGVHTLKNISDPVQLFRVLIDGVPEVAPAAAPTAAANPVAPVRPVTAGTLLDQRINRLETALSMPMGHLADRLERKWARKEERRRRREERRRRKWEGRSPIEGAVYMAFALIAAGVALTHSEHLFWMIWVALGFAIRGAQIFGNNRRSQPNALPQQERESAPLPTSSVNPVKQPEINAAEKAKVDALCDRLRADLASGPAIARDVVRDPEKTVESLRRSCHELLKRVAQLQSFGSEEEERRLDEDRRGLTARIAAQSDDVARERLQAALASVDSQIQQRSEMKRLAARLEAEYTRLYYSLQNLHSQVLRLKSVDLSAEDVQRQALRQTADQLAAELDAVAEALEEVNRRDAASTGSSTASPLGAEVMPVDPGAVPLSPEQNRPGSLRTR